MRQPPYLAILVLGFAVSGAFGLGEWLAGCDWHPPPRLRPMRDASETDFVLDCHATVRLTNDGPQITVGRCEPVDGGAPMTTKTKTDETPAETPHAREGTTAAEGGKMPDADTGAGVPDVPGVPEGATTGHGQAAVDAAKAAGGVKTDGASGR